MFSCPYLGGSSAGSHFWLYQVSKNAAKKAARLERLAREKAEKAAAKAAAGGGQGGSAKAKASEEDLDPTAYFANRCTAVDEIVSGGGNAYPHKFHVSHSLPEFVAEFGEQTKEGQQLDRTVSVAGRVLSKRASGSKLIFYTLQGDGVQLQVRFVSL